MANNARLYPYSLAEAQRQNEVEQWLDSRTDNARCRKSIETAIIGMPNLCVSLFIGC